MTIELGLMLTAMLGIGFLAQWLAWRVKLPAILFLLLAGIVLGPVTGLLNPDKMLGKLLFPVVSLSVALILFEGSLSLRFHELKGIGGAVRGLVSYGAVLTLLLLAAAAHYLAGLGWAASWLFGALTCVTGPTVIAPMLRTLRPNAKVANVLRWEGIVVDPLGALFAVLIYEAIVSHQEGHTIGVFLLTVVCGLLTGLVAGGVLATLLRRQMVPEYLQNYAAMAAVLVTFTLSNTVEQESGLLAVTIMGVALGNIRGVHIEDILDFKEHLTTLLVSMLFIILAARLQWPLPHGVLGAGLLLLLVAQLVVRPLTVLLSSPGSSLSWRERVLIGWIAPRGIVAAAVSALFAMRLEPLHIQGSSALVPLVFIMIIGTVVLQSATARPLACWLRVAEPEPRGLLIFGANPAAMAIAKALVDTEFKVVVADDDWDRIRAARMAGFHTFFGNPASSYAERHLDLTGIGRLLAMSVHRERNTLVCVHYRQEFGRNKVYRLNDEGPEDSLNSRTILHDSLLAPALFDDTITHGHFLELLAKGWRIKSTRLSATFDWPHFIEQYGSSTVLLFGVDDKDDLKVALAHRELEPRPGWTVIALVPPERSEKAAEAA